MSDWDAAAASFDEEPDHGLRDPSLRAAWKGVLLPLLPVPPARVADLGCGTGSLAVLLAGQGYDVSGLDSSPAMVDLAREKASAAGVIGSFAVGDASAPEMDAVDVVLCRHVLWALPSPAEVLRRWIQLLRPDGRLVLVEGSWSTGSGLRAAQLVDLLAGLGRSAEVTVLDDPALWATRSPTSGTSWSAA